MPWPLFAAIVGGVAAIGGAFAQRKAAKAQASAEAARYAAQTEAIKAERERLRIDAELQKIQARAAISERLSTAREMEAAALADEYQAQIADQNAAMAKWLALDALDRGRVAASDHYRKVRRLSGRQVAGFAANGILVGAGTAESVVEDTHRLGRLDVDRIMANSERESFKHLIDEWNSLSRGRLLRMGAAGRRRGAAAVRRSTDYIRESAGYIDANLAAAEKAAESGIRAGSYAAGAALKAGSAAATAATLGGIAQVADTWYRYVRG